MSLTPEQSAESAARSQRIAARTEQQRQVEARDTFTRRRDLAERALLAHLSSDSRPEEPRVLAAYTWAVAESFDEVTAAHEAKLCGEKGGGVVSALDIARRHEARVRSLVERLDAVNLEPAVQAQGAFARMLMSWLVELAGLVLFLVQREVERSTPAPTCEQLEARGARLRQARESSGLSMGDVARALKVSVVLVSDVERGNEVVDEDMWDRMWECLARVEPKDAEPMPTKTWAAHRDEVVSVERATARAKAITLGADDWIKWAKLGTRAASIEDLVDSQRERIVDEILAAHRAGQIEAAGVVSQRAGEVERAGGSRELVSELLRLAGVLLPVVRPSGAKDGGQ